MEFMEVGTTQEPVTFVDRLGFAAHKNSNASQNTIEVLRATKQSHICSCANPGGLVDIEDLLTCVESKQPRDANNLPQHPLAHEGPPVENDWVTVTYRHHVPKPRPHERLVRIAAWHLRRRTPEREELNVDLLGHDSRRTAESVMVDVSHKTRNNLPEGGSRKVRNKKSRRLGDCFDATKGYPGEGPPKKPDAKAAKSAKPDAEWRTKGGVKLEDIRRNFPGVGDGPIISEAQRLICAGQKSSDKITAEQLAFLIKLWPQSLNPKPIGKPTQAGPAIEEKDEGKRHKTEQEIAHDKRDKAQRRAADKQQADLKALEGPGAAAAAERADPRNVPAIPPPDDKPPPRGHWTEGVEQSEKDAATYDDILAEIVDLVHTKFQHANIHSATDCTTVLKIVHAHVKTRDLVGVVNRLNRHYSRTADQVPGMPLHLLPAPHLTVERLYDREVHRFATSARRIQPAMYAQGDGFSGTSMLGVQARGPISATIMDGLCGRPNLNLYARMDQAANSSLASACENARTTPLLSCRAPEGTPEWKLRVADTASRSGLSAVVGFAEECGKKLFSSAAVKAAVLLVPGAHVAAAAGIAGYIGASAVISAYEAYKQPKSLPFFARFAGHVATGLTGTAGTIAHVAYNMGTAAVGRSDLALDSLHALRSQPSECLAGIVQPKPVYEKSKLTVGSEPCTPTFGVQRLIQVGNFTQAVPRQCVCNSEIALTHRVLRELPMHSNLDAVEKQWLAARDTALHISRKIGRGPAMDFNLWLNRYAGNKKRVFSNLRAARPPMVHTTKAKVFIKAEKYPRSIEGAKNSPPRIISGCPEELTYHTGRWLTATAKRAAANLSRPDGPGGGGRIFYTCGYNADEIGDLLTEAINCVKVEGDDQLVFLEDDQSKFDQHIGKAAFGCLDYVYRGTLPKRIRKLLRRGRSTGGMRNGTRYSVDYTMQSGYPDTSLGDTILNAVMKTFIHGKGGNWASLICGDDSVTVTTLGELRRLGGIPGIVAAYAKFGMEVEASYSTNVLDIGYCSGRFLPQFGSHVLVPKTGKILSKSFWSTREYNDLNLRAWANGVCNSLDLIGVRDPIVASVSRVVRQQTNTRKVLKTEVAGGQYSAVYQSQNKEVDWSNVYYAYAHWYNLFESDVQHLCGPVAEQFLLDARVDDPLLSHIVRIDTPSG